MTHEYSPVARGWTLLAYSIESLSDGSTIYLYENENRLHIEGVGKTIYKAIGDDFHASLGSFHGEAYFLQGFIFDFKYNAGSSTQLENPGTTFFNLNGLSQPGTGKDCDWDQYLNAENECTQCDPTCTSGCTNGEVCFECHPTCRTCTGHRVDECIDCWCGAEVDGDGCCACNGANGFTKHGDKCKQTACFAEGCDACHKDVCIHCKHGFELDEYNVCQRCNTGSWNDDPRLEWCNLE